MKSALRTLMHSALSCTLAALAVPTVAAFAQSPISFTPGPQVTLYPGLISTVAGGGTASPTNGASATSVDIGALFITMDQNGNQYYADTNACVVYEISHGTISAIAGNGICGLSGDTGPATQAEIHPFLSNVAVDTLGNVYIADTLNHLIRKVTVSTGIITTVAGTITVNPSGPAQGSFGFSGDNGPATQAQLWRPYGVSVDPAGNLYIADTDNGRIRMVTASTGIITTVAGTGNQFAVSGDGGPATQAQIGSVRAVYFDNAGNYYIPDISNCVIRKVSAPTQIISLYAGNYHCGFSGDNGPATSAQLELPNSGVFDAAGNLYIADTFNAIIRKVSPNTGIITTYSGIVNPLIDFTGKSVTNLPRSGDNGPADKAYFGQTYGIAIDPADNLYVADTEVPALIRKITSTAAPLTFPATTVGATSAAQMVTVANTGDQPLVFSGIAVSAGFVQQPAGGRECSATATLPPAGECTLHIAYAPVQVGMPVSGTVTLTDNANAQSASPQVIALSAAAAVAKAGVLATISSSAPNANLGSAITFTAGFAPVTSTMGANAGTPTGTVQFLSGATVLATVPLTGGSAAYTTSGLAAGNYSISAVYGGDANFLGATTPVLAQQVTAPGFTLQATPSSITIVAGQSGSATLSVATAGGLNGSIALACSGLPQNATCTFSPASLTANGSNAPLTAQVTIATSAQTARQLPFHSPFGPTGESETAAVAGLFLLCGIGSRTRTLRRGIKLFSLFVLAGALVSMTGCGGSSPKTPTAPSTSTVTITASSGGVAPQTAALSVTVTH